MVTQPKSEQLAEIFGASDLTLLKAVINDAREDRENDYVNARGEREVQITRARMEDMQRLCVTFDNAYMQATYYNTPKEDAS